MWKNNLQTLFIEKDVWELKTDLTFEFSKKDIRNIHKTIYTWERLGVYIFEKQDGYVIIVPNGFFTDLGSSPRILWWFISPWDIARPAALHDYLYYRLKNGKNLPASHKRMMRKQADRIFKRGLKDDDILGMIRQQIAYRLVRLFGIFTLRMNGTHDRHNRKEHINEIQAKGSLEQSSTENSEGTR